MTKTKDLIRTTCLVFTLSALIALQGCTVMGIATGAGAAAGVAASQEGGLSRAARDARIQAEINDLWFRYDVDMFTKLDMTVNNGRVLLTGVVQDPEHRVEAVRLAWQPPGVEQVINEIRVAESQGVTGFAKDTWISTQLRTKLTLDKEILSINYNIDTVQGTVYLMGFAQNRVELNRVVELARTIKGVNGVVSYVKFVGGADKVSNAPNNDVTYQDTYAEDSYDANAYDQNYYEEPANAPYEDTSSPLDVRAPQDRSGSREYYPNNVEPIEAEPIEVEQLGEQVIIRDPRAPQPSGQGLTPQDQRITGPSSESLLEPTTELPNATIQKVEPTNSGWD